MKKLNKFLSLLLSIALIIMAFNLCVFASDGGAGSGNSGTSNNLQDDFQPGIVLVGLKNADIIEGVPAESFAGISITGIDTLFDITENADSTTETEITPSDSNVADVKKIIAIYLESQEPDDVFEAITLLENVPEVAFAQPDYIAYPEVIPNDQRYSNLWGMAKISAPTAWDTFTGSSDIVVGILDTGTYYTHEDLANNIWTNQNTGTYTYTNNGTIICNNDLHGWNFADDNNHIWDDGGYASHGTHVAGTIGAVGNNTAGVTGINWNVSLATLKICSSSGGGAAQSDTIRAIAYANHYGMRVLNYSFSGYRNARNGDALYYAIKAFNGLFLYAAGNEGSNVDPAGYDLTNYIAVGATNQSDNNLYNYGQNSVHLGAPGSSIQSTIPNNSYSNKSGTSMATPHVSGAAALLMGYRPDLTPSEVRDIILESVDILPQLADKYITGGRLNINRMLEMADVETKLSIKVPGLAYDRTSELMTLNTINLSAPDLFNSRMYLVINKYNASNISVPISTTTNSVIIADDGIGLYTLTPSMQSFNATNNFIEILIYNSSGLEKLITREFIRPVVFNLSLFE